MLAKPSRVLQTVCRRGRPCGCPGPDAQPAGGQCVGDHEGRPDRLARSGTRTGCLAYTAVCWVACLIVTPAGPVPQHPRYPSPTSLAWSPDGRLLAVTDPGRGQLVVVDGAVSRVRSTIDLPSPQGLCWDPTGRRLWVSLATANQVAEVDAGTWREVRRLGAGLRPGPLAWAGSPGRLLVGNTTGRGLSVLDAETGRPRGQIACSGEPSAIAVCGPTAVVANLTPVGDATAPDNAAVVDLVDLVSQTARPVRLPSGATNLSAVAISPDGRWAYLPHVLARFNLPTTQAERGWINTNALSIIDLSAQRLYVTVLLDHVNEGAADPWGAAVAADGQVLWVSLAGAHQLARVDLARLHPLLAGQIPADSPLLQQAPEYRLTAQNSWAIIRQNPDQRAVLTDDLTALHLAGVLELRALPGRGPRGLALSPDGGALAVAEYFSGQVTRLDLPAGGARSLRLGEVPADDLARRGEALFGDAGTCFQRWHSCATCHPGNGRADGLNWDLLNDGIGNPKNTRSLLLADRRLPLMAHGVRGDLPEAVRSGFRFIHFREPSADEVAAVTAYIASLEPEPSPYRGPRSELTAGARRGKKLFEDQRVGCAKCHAGPLGTDQQAHDVGTRAEFDTSGEFVTPVLVELWRTAPYLHDGRACSLVEVLRQHNCQDRHGVTSHLTQTDIEDLAAYLRSW